MSASHTYGQTRDRETLRRLMPAIDAFSNRYKNPPPTTSPCPRRTLFLFPGGMASQLSRARRKFVDGLSAWQQFNYDTLWLSFGALFEGHAARMAMKRDISGVFRERDNHIIIADDVVNIFGLTPYDGFTAWCTQNNLDWFIFPWDWRRRLKDAAHFFVHVFLPAFRARVMAAGCPDPLATFVLVGHSFGGMVVNLLLRGNPPALANMTHAITVATPFYGYPSQVHRWFEGDVYVNGPFDAFRAQMMKTIASLPGLYTLQFLDAEMFDDPTTHSGLGSDPAFPLNDYPSKDATDSTRRADPYFPEANGAQVRYPGTTGFQWTELDYADLQIKYLASPMAPNLAKKFFNIRGVRTQGDGVTVISDTADRITWDWIDPTYNASNATPIVNTSSAPGDDTQPAWTTRLVTNDPARWITVKGSGLQHMFLMNEPGVLSALATILCGPGVIMMSAENAPSQPEPASDEEVVQFMRWLSKQRGRIRQWPNAGDKDLRKEVPAEFRDKLPSLARRIMMDILKRPGPKGMWGREAPKARPAGRKPPGGRPRRRAPKKKR